jgi:hypothetical protein
LRAPHGGHDRVRVRLEQVGGSHEGVTDSLDAVALDDVLREN